jgi:hypothetical protein
LTALLLALVLVAAGCGGGDDGGSSSGDDDGGEATETTEAEPEGQVLIEDDFDDDDNLWLPDGLDAEGQQDVNVGDGRLSFATEADGYEGLDDDQIVIPAQLWPSVLDGVSGDLGDAEVTAEVEFEVPGTAGLACRIADPAPDATDLRAYFFQVSSTGGVHIAELNEEGDTLNGLEAVPESDDDEDQPDEIPVEGAPFDYEANETYELSFRCQDVEDGVELTGSIDGEEVVTTVDDEDPIDSGQAGVIAGQSGLATEVEGFEPYDVTFDSVTITNLGDEIDEDDLDDAADEAEEAADAPAEEPEEPTITTGVNPDLINSPALGAPLDPTSIAEYGTDSRFDLLASDCYLANFESCDTLYRDTPVGSSYEAYGATCGGRLEARINGDCLDAGNFASQPGSYGAAEIAEYGSDAVFDGLADACEVGDLEACDELYQQTPVDSGYEEFGSTCGARTTDLYDGDCIVDQS